MTIWLLCDPVCACKYKTYEKETLQFACYFLTIIPMEIECPFSALASGRGLNWRILVLLNWNLVQF